MHITFVHKIKVSFVCNLATKLSNPFYYLSLVFSLSVVNPENF